MRTAAVGTVLFVGLVATAVGAAWADDPKGKGATMKAGIEKSAFGKTADGAAVDLYVLTNGRGMTAKITNYGCIVTELTAPDRNGKFEDVVLGFDNLDSYLAGHPFFGAVAGRVANRIANGKFTLDGKEYTLAVNNGPNSLHGGLKGFDKRVWNAQVIDGESGPALRLRYTSPDAEEGYPGTLTATVTYSLTADNSLRIDYEATTDKATPVNLTNHSYFNLRGATSGSDVLGTELLLVAANYTPTDDTLIPTGEIKPVRGTPLDFTQSTPIGARIKEFPKTKGYDHNFVLDSGGKTLALGARAFEPNTGRVMEMLTTEPGVQLYTANHLDGKLKGIGGVAYQQHAGFCLEAQHFPDSINHPNFPSVVLRPGETYRQTTVYRFSAK